MPRLPSLLPCGPPFMPPHLPLHLLPHPALPPPLAPPDSRLPSPPGAPATEYNARIRGMKQNFLLPQATRHRSFSFSGLLPPSLSFYFSLFLSLSSHSRSFPLLKLFLYLSLSLLFSTALFLLLSDSPNSLASLLHSLFFPSYTSSCLIHHFPQRNVGF